MKRYVGYSFLCMLFISVLITVNSKSKLAKKTKEAESAKLIIPSIPQYSEKKFNTERKKEVEEFVDEAARYFEKHDINKALSAFAHNKEFRRGELYIFVYNNKGSCLSIGQFQNMIWENLFDYKDPFGTYVIQKIIDKAEKGKGWIGYQWRGTTKLSYIKGVMKDDRLFVVGAGFYPISKRDTAVSLVKAATENFKQEMAKKNGGTPATIFSKISYPKGPYVRGNLYLYALKFDGTIVAQGDRPDLIGQNALQFKSNQDIIAGLNASVKGATWVEYISKRAEKVAYAEKVTDRKGNNYFIACGYYPKANREEAKKLVADGYKYLSITDIKTASDAFSSATNDTFRYGDLWLFLYDYKGECLANGKHPTWRNSNRWNAKDDDGKYYIREIIERAKDGGGWFSHRLDNGYRFVYILPIKKGDQDLAIGCGLYPISKPETMKLMVDGAASLLKSESNDKAFRAFKKQGRFIKGDLSIFVFDFQGICYAYGSDYTYLLKDMFAAKDDDGRPYVKMFINTAKDAPGNVIYRENGRLKEAYVMRVDKGDDESFVVGSSYFLE